LLEMKSKVEGCRGLIGKLQLCASQQAILEARGREAPRDELARAKRLTALLTPIVKAYVSDQAWRVCELAMQVHGGVGYLADHPLEQYARDVRVLSIWEGTNYIQAQDLLRDKLGFGNEGPMLHAFAAEIEGFLARRRVHPELGAELDAFERSYRV